MNVKKHPLDNYKRFLLNRATTTTAFLELIEHTVSCEDEAAHYCFHRVMVHSWNDNIVPLCDVLSEYFTSSVIPINIINDAGITSFYTSNLNLILKIMRLDFMFPYQRNMFNIDILFNDKTAANLFDNNVKLDDVVAGVVSQRFSDKQELDLSDFCNDQEFKDKNICFYKVSLLSHFKILMLRMGRDTKSLNLSNNKLSAPPLDVMNFFIKGDLTAINLSHNNIASISDLVRVSSKIEKLWVEGNPLCEENDPSVYVKQITMKFPRLNELDGIKLNEHGVMFPFVRNFTQNPSRVTKMVVEKFLTLYFSHYDSLKRRKNIDGFYDDYAVLTMTAGLTEAEAMEMPEYAYKARNFLDHSKMEQLNRKQRVYATKHVLLTVHSQLPATVHDPATFTVDIMMHDKTSLIVIVDGIFKEKDSSSYDSKVFQFRRTFVFKTYKNQYNSLYYITNEMYHITLPTKEQKKNSFKNPIRNMNALALINPEREESDTIVKLFCHVTQLRREEAEVRLRLHSWDIKQAIQEFISDVTKNKIGLEQMMDEDDFSDSSSLIDEEMVDHEVVDHFSRPFLRRLAN